MELQILSVQLKKKKMHSLKEKYYVFANNCFLMPLHLQFIEKTKKYLYRPT